jgi:hypothetical protein
MTAGLTGYQTQAGQLAENNIGAGQGLLGDASQGASAGASYHPMSVTPQALASTNLQPYMNPYQQDVINTTMNDLDLQRQRDINNQSGQFTSAGAFGGSRQGVSDALTNEAYGRIGAQTLAGLNSQNFNQAQQAALSDIGNNLQGQLANQSAGIQGANLNLGAAGLLGNLAGQQQQMGQNDASFLNGFGQQQQATNQFNLSNLYNEFLRGQLTPQQQAQIQLGLLGSTPMLTNSQTAGSNSGAQTGTSTGTTTGTNTGSTSGTNNSTGWGTGQSSGTNTTKSSGGLFNDWLSWMRAANAGG